MKILVLKQNITDKITLMKGLDLAVQWSKTIGLTLDFTFADTQKQFSSIPVTNDVVTGGYVVNGVEIFQEAKRLGFNFIPESVCVLIYDWTFIKPQPTNPAESGLAISIPIQFYNIYPEVLAQYLLHEFCHYYFAYYGKIDITHLLNNRNMNPTLYDQWSSKQPKDFYLYLLSTLIKPIQSKLLDAIIQVESGGDDNAIGDTTLQNKAYGALQIRQGVVDNVNSKLGTLYKSQDCLGNRTLSVLIWNTYWTIFTLLTTDEDKARAWNGGPYWKNKYNKPGYENYSKNIDNYWSKVKAILNPIVLTQYLVLRRGSQGTLVKELQTKLNKKNGSNLAIDGIFGGQTLRQVEYFQSMNQLVANGIVGPKTWKVLNL